jgi:hypothetical protein
MASSLILSAVGDALVEILRTGDPLQAPVRSESGELKAMPAKRRPAARTSHREANIDP